MDPAPPPVPPERQQAVDRVVRELERHVAADGWDAPVRLFALVRTADALARDPRLAGQLPPEVVRAATSDAEHLTAVEQEGLPDAESLTDLLARIAWPPTVDGAAVVVERVVLPEEAEAAVPDGEAAALRHVSAHPDRRDVRLAAGVLRDGARACAVRVREHDADDQVALAPDLTPGLVAALTATLTP